MASLPRSILALFIFVWSLGFAEIAKAGDIKILGSDVQMQTLSENQILNIVKQAVDPNHYRQVRVQLFSKYIVLQLLRIGYHRVDFMRINLDQQNHILNLQADYKYSNEELLQSSAQSNYVCPDVSAQIIAFAPNEDVTEQAVTADVIRAAKAAGYKVVSLLKADATRANYLAYMTCPNLIGNFYDGDSNPQSFITVDGLINSSELSAMKALFRYRVTNIWVACEAFNDPMFSSVTKDAQAQKYAAGINDLLVGPSDNAAACAMKAAISGSPMTQAFHDCYKQFDQAADQWGFAGAGSDLFGQ